MPKIAVIAFFVAKLVALGFGVWIVLEIISIGWAIVDGLQNSAPK